MKPFNPKKILVPLLMLICFNVSAGIGKKDSLFLENQIDFLIDRTHPEPDSVLSICQWYLTQDEIKKSDFFTASFLSISANANLKKANYKEAQKLIREAIEIREKLGVLSHLATSYGVMGEILGELGEHQSALLYQKRALEIKRKTNNPDYIKGAYSAVGVSYYNLNNYDSAYYYHQKALDIYAAQKDSIGIAVCYANLANILYDQDYNLESIELNRKALNLFRSKERIAQSVYPTLNIAYTYEYLEEIDSAIYYYKLALSSAELGGNYRLTDNIYHGLAGIYTLLGEPDSAVIMFQKYIAYRDSIFEQKKVNAILEYQTQYETKEAEQQAAFEKSEKEKVQAQNASNRKTIYVLLSVVALILGIVIYMVRNARQKSKLKALEIDSKNQEIDTLLKEQEAKSYAAMLEGQNTERERIAQDLHDRLGGTLAAVKVHFNLMDKKIEELQSENRELFNKVNSMLSDAVQDVRRISHDLASNRLSKLGLKGALEDLAQILNTAKKLEVDFFMDDSIPALDKKKEQEVYAILQELVSNTLKHANASSVEMQLNKQEEMLNILYEDNGIGFEMKNVEKKGLGLAGLSNRVDRLEGTINFDSVVGRGTIVIINIPL